MRQSPRQDVAIEDVLSTPAEIESWLGRMPLVSCTLRVTKACDARCPYCYSSSAQPLPDELLASEALDVVDGIVALGALRLFISGGEPTLCPHVCQIVERAAVGGLRVSLSTHGGRLDTDLIDRLASAGLSQLQISLDAAGPLHDRVRMIDGLYDRAVASLAIAANRLPARCDLTVATVVTSVNVSHVVPLARAVEMAGARTFALVPLVVTGRASAEWGIPISEMLALIRTLERVLDATSMRLAVLAPPALAPAPRVSGALMGYVRPFPLELAIDANGDVALADLHLNPPKRLIGNVRREALAQLYRRAVAAASMQLPAARTDIQGVCSQCVHWDLCGGGNRPLAEHVSGRPDSSDPYCQAAYDAGLFPASSLVRRLD